jgi:6-phosphogluconolactonase
MRIFNDHSVLSEAAAEIFVESAAQAIAERGRFLAALSGGTTPIALYRLLANRNVEWAHSHLFWGDERCVPVDDPGNNYGQAREALISHVSIPAKNVHRIQSELKPEGAAREYVRLLKRFAEPPLMWPRFDLVLLGMGADGHVASIFPGSPLEANKPVIAVTADTRQRPANRVTLTPPVLNAARHVLFLISGQSKAETLASVLKGDSPEHFCPAHSANRRKNHGWWMHRRRGCETCLWKIRLITKYMKKGSQWVEY